MSHHRHAQATPRPLHADLRQVFDALLNTNTATGTLPTPGTWVPHVDIREEAGRFVILADLPGVDPESIEVQMDKGVLSIKGARPKLDPQEGARYSRIERAHGVFARRFTLPDSADAEGITASGRHGVLEITIPKRAEVTPRRIQVQ